jgi:hypothetical protein
VYVLELRQVDSWFTSELPRRSAVVRNVRQRKCRYACIAMPKMEEQRRIKMAEFTKEQQKFMSQLLELDGAVTHGSVDVYARGVESPSPSLNYCFDNTWCLPQGYTLLLGGPAKGGKSLIINSMIGQMHRDDPTAICIRYNTEFREQAQVTPQQLKVWGIDQNRLRAFEANLPEMIFDKIEEIVPKMIQMGLNLRLVIIDSLNDIKGKRAVSAVSVMNNSIGDLAMTLQTGLGRIKGVLRTNNVSAIYTTHTRSEMDPNLVARGQTTKFAVSHYVKHTAEYFLRVERLETKAGRTDLLGNEFKDGTHKVDLSGQNKGEGEESGHRIRVKMMDSSLGRPGRIGIFTIDHDHGIVNTHEEVLLLGIGIGIVGVAGGGNYSIVKHDAASESLSPYLDKSWRGKEAILAAIRDDSVLYQGILKTCKAIDLDRRNGIFYDEEGKRTNQPVTEKSPDPV